ncbi:hypothetical protein Taro_001068 [Colocasia esculenta]|uniref:Uncharacterized protein n=1 Tax=Colocasia esculenta TaxID=4460 RepID=A0A843TCJ0_COLES|nr:hypothetical protein [Colocasia esculenta]
MNSCDSESLPEKSWGGTKPQRGLHEATAASSSLLAAAPAPPRAAAGDTKLQATGEEEGETSPPRRGGGKGKKPKEGEGAPAKAFSLRPPECDRARRRVTNRNVTAAHTTTRTRPLGMPRQPDIRSDTPILLTGVM